MTYEYDDLMFNFGDWYGIAAMCGFCAERADKRCGGWARGIRACSISTESVTMWRGAGRRRWPGNLSERRRLEGVGTGERIPARVGRASCRPGGTRTRRRFGRCSTRRPISHETVVVDRPVPVETCGAAETVDGDARPMTSTWRWTRNLQCAGMVVLSDNWFPGWRADDRWKGRADIPGRRRAARDRRYRRPPSDRNDVPPRRQSTGAPIVSLGSVPGAGGVMVVLASGR